MESIGLVGLGLLENFSVTGIFIMKQYWREGQIFETDGPRPRSALLFLSGASAEYTFENGERLVAERGSLVAIPEGARYSTRFFGIESHPVSILVEFSLSLDGPFTIVDRVSVLKENIYGTAIAEAIEKMAEDYSMPERPYLEIRALFFRLFSLLSERAKRKNIVGSRFATIEWGIRYLETDESQALSIDEIASRCFVTPAYFRRLFREYAGASPIEYRTQRRMERAIELLLYSPLSVEEISDTLGYDTPSYFCRVFKKSCAVAPSTYRKKNLGIEK